MFFGIQVLIEDGKGINIDFSPSFEKDEFFLNSLYFPSSCLIYFRKIVCHIRKSSSLSNLLEVAFNDFIPVFIPNAFGKIVEKLPC